MATICPNCGFHNPPGMRFCGNCGTRLVEIGQEHRPEESPSAIENLGVMTGEDLLDRFRKAGLEASGQRRNVTILFVDLSGYTRLSEQLGEEELFEIVQKFIRLLVEDVYRYEGMVDKLTGDGLMALFGAPIAHENDAERAIRSAQDMMIDVARLSHELNLPGKELHLHIGLNSGTVVVGGIGGNGMMNYTAIGDSVNLARRLEESAKPGEILVSQKIYNQVYRLFEFQPLPPLSLKNVSEKIIAYRLISPKTPPTSIRGIEGLRAPLIGREKEFGIILQRMNRLVENHQGGMILLVGDGGIGKSRLTSEIREAFTGRNLLILEGRSLTYRKAISYWIFQEIVLNYLGLSFEASQEQIHNRLCSIAQQNLQSLGMSDQKIFDKILCIESMMFMDPGNEIRVDEAFTERLRYLNAEQLQQQIFLAVRDLLLAAARQKPIMLILEDLHWADNSSIALLKFLIDTTLDAPIFIYGITRPFENGAVKTIHDRAKQRLGKHYLYLHLQALTPDVSEQLLTSLLNIKNFPEQLRDQIIQRSAGLPFYLEEILRMLIENKVIYYDGHAWNLAEGADSAQIGVPETLQGLILTRFDRLSLLERRILQIAAVIGYQFNEKILSLVVQSGSWLAETKEEDSNDMELPAFSETAYEDALKQLISREFILPQNGWSGSGKGQLELLEDEAPFEFRHALVSDAVYSTLLQRDRRDLHTRVGLAIEKYYSDRIDTQVEVLAGHFLRSSLQDRALFYLIAAGQKAASRYANEQAQLLFSQALEILPKAEFHTPDQEAAVYQGLGDAYLVRGEYATARKYFSHGLDVFQNFDISYQDEKEKEKAAPIKTRQICALYRKISRTYEGQGEYDKALERLRIAIELLQKQNAPDGVERANILNDMGWIDFRRANLDQAEARFLEALHLSEEAGQIDLVASVLNRLAGICFQRDTLDLAKFYLERSLRLREQMGDVAAVARVYNNLGLIAWRQSNLDVALEIFNRSYQLQKNLGDVEGLVVLRTNMGLIEMDRFHYDQAESYFQEALDKAERIGHTYHVSKAWMHLSLLNVYRKNWDACCRYAELSQRGFAELGIDEVNFDLIIMRARAYLGLHETEKLEVALKQIHEILMENSEKTELPSEEDGRAHRLLGEVAESRENLLEAKQEFEQSIQIFKTLGSPIEQARTLILLADVLMQYHEPEAAQEKRQAADSLFGKMGIQNPPLA